MDKAIWAELGIPETKNIREIRRAYALRLRLVHPEDNAEGFQRLRSAYESAIFFASLAEASELRERISFTVQEPDPPSRDAVDERDAVDDQSLEQRAQEIVITIFELVENKRELEASDKLIQHLRSEELQNIELKYFVEHALLEKSVFGKTPPFIVLDKAAAELGWGSEGSRNKPELQYLLDRLEGWREYQKLLKAAKSSTQFVTPLQSKAAAVLTSPYNEWRFYIDRICYPGLAKVVKDKIELFEIQVPAVEQYLDQRTLEWWRKRKTEWGNLTLLLILVFVIGAFVINNFSEIPKPVLAFLGILLFLAGYGIWRSIKGFKSKVSSKTTGPHPFVMSLANIVGMVVAATVMPVLQVLPPGAIFSLVSVVGMISLFVFLRRRRNR